MRVVKAKLRPLPVSDSETFDLALSDACCGMKHDKIIIFVCLRMQEVLLTALQGVQVTV